MVRSIFAAVVSSLFGIGLVSCAWNGNEAVPDDKEIVTDVGDCISDRSRLLALDFETFDQDYTQGFRSIAEKAGCQLYVADLIGDYRETNADKLRTAQLNTLLWHEGQIRALAGDTAKAIAAFEGSYKPRNRVWNLYVDASIAFLKKDRGAFDVSYRELERLPKPDYWDQLVENTRSKYNYTPVWPSNINVLRAFDRCFDETYQEAYGSCNKGISLNDTEE